MPHWHIHDKWAERMGIPKKVSRFVSGLVDMPEKCQEYRDFCNADPEARIYKKGKPTSMTLADFTSHDAGRHDVAVRKIQLKFLSQKGSTYEKSYYLHQTLDYLGKWILEWPNNVPNFRDILTGERLNKNVGDPRNENLQTVIKFVIENSDEIFIDCKLSASPSFSYTANVRQNAY